MLSPFFKSHCRPLPPRVGLRGADFHILWAEFVGCASGNLFPQLFAGGLRSPTSNELEMASSTLDHSDATVGSATAPTAPHSRRRFGGSFPSMLVSLVVHALAVVMLALNDLPEPENAPNTISLAETVENEPLDEFQEQLQDTIRLDDRASTTDATDEQTNKVIADIPDIGVANDADMAQAVLPQLDILSTESAIKGNITQPLGTAMGTGFSGRGSALKSLMLQEAGGNDASEAAVARALEWLAQRQQRDGTWNFDHRRGPKAGRGENPGEAVVAVNGATALALLPFLGAGITHKEGKYKQNVQAGLVALGRRMKRERFGGSFHEPEGDMYSHGLASIVLCEAYGMTNDKTLIPYAQQALNFIVYAQDPAGGGWRYQPREPGDTSVVGWQLMALKSGRMAFLQAPDATFANASRFLDYVSNKEGYLYGYNKPYAVDDPKTLVNEGSGSPATVAIGALCRMYLGAKKDDPKLVKSVEWIAERGPMLNGSEGNMYYNYYATQVMRQYGGDHWKNWNAKLRDPLIAAQQKDGLEAGSWFIREGLGTEKGGRLYSTAMCTMVLEVYYRHMPIYQNSASDDKFEL